MVLSTIFLLYGFPANIYLLYEGKRIVRFPLNGSSFDLLMGLRPRNFCGRKTNPFCFMIRIRLKNLKTFVPRPDSRS